MTTPRPVVIGVFENRDQALDAIEALKAADFQEEEIGFIAQEEAQAGSVPGRKAEGSGKAEGAATGAVAGAAGGGVLGGIAGAVAAGLIPGIGPIVAGGILAATLGGAAAGAAVGGLVGVLTGLGLSEEEARYYEGELRSGRTLVPVKAVGRADLAMEVLRRFGAYDITTAGAVRTAGTGSLLGPTTSADSSEGERRKSHLRQEESSARRNLMRGAQARSAKRKAEETAATTDSSEAMKWEEARAAPSDERDPIHGSDVVDDPEED